MGHRGPAPALMWIAGLPAIVGYTVALSLPIDMASAETLDAAASWHGQHDDDLAATSVAGVGDVDGDGFDDLLIGAPDNGETADDAGQAYLVLGDPAGWGLGLDLATVDASFLGEATGDEAGFCVAGAGDVDGDGLDDLAIGAPYNDDGAWDAGQIYLLFGQPSGWAMDTPLSAADASFVGYAGGDYAGTTIAGSGDLDGDGLDDLLIGAPYNDEAAAAAGQVYIVLGRAVGWAMDVSLSLADGSVLGQYDLRLGVALDLTPDVDGDGLDDLLLGSLYDDSAGFQAGKVFLIPGMPTMAWAQDMTLDEALASFVGEATFDYAGASVAGAGDVDGDGFGDLLIGAPGNGEAIGDAGQVYLIRGRSAGWALDTPLSSADASFWGESAADELGSAVAGAGDVDGDGLADLLFSGPGHDAAALGAGRVYLVRGRDVGWQMDQPLPLFASAWLDGEEEDDWLGQCLDGAGDVDGDGLDDLLTGTPWSDDPGNHAGEAYLVLGYACGDQDGDGFDRCAETNADADCDDGDPTVYPGAAEDLCDGIDSDCAGDDELADADGDGYSPCDGDCDDDALDLDPADLDHDGLSSCDGDCDDGDPTIYPGAVDDCWDGIDSDCLDDLDLELDADGDGWPICGGDCNDANAAVYPGAPEWCNGLDDDCDGVVVPDEMDDDEDGYRICDGDCDDTSRWVHPNAPDICDDGIDTDCSGDVTLEYDHDDDGQSACDGDCDDTDPTVYLGAPDDPCDAIDSNCDGVIEFTDLDADGYTTCQGDCNDLAPSVHPGADEVCNGIDDDCDPSTVDDQDSDGDGSPYCADCDDTDPTVFPGAREDCDGHDDNCDGSVDEGFDEDLDGYSWCFDGDCDDSAATIHPGSFEIPYDGIDQNCDGGDLTDVDGDGYAGGAAGSDCDDLRVWIHPGAIERCTDDVDGDCDGVLDRDEAECAGATCTCRVDAHPGGGVPAAALALAALAAHRRRRRHAATPSG